MRCGRQQAARNLAIVSFSSLALDSEISLGLYRAVMRAESTVTVKLCDTLVGDDAAVEVVRAALELLAGRRTPNVADVLGMCVDAMDRRLRVVVEACDTSLDTYIQQITAVSVTVSGGSVAMLGVHVASSASHSPAAPLSWCLLLTLLSAGRHDSSAIGTRAGAATAVLRWCAVAARSGHRSWACAGCQRPRCGWTHGNCEGAAA